METAGLPPQVIVVGGDGVLWDGLVDEFGPRGIRVGPDRWAVRATLADQVDGGRLVCVASRNNERDVRSVFTQRPDLPLTLDQVTTTRVNWAPTSANVRSIAEELGVGLDRILLLDSDPVACAEVRAHCPQALTFHLPIDQGRARRFLDHLWWLDRRMAAAVRLLRRSGRVPSFRDFLATLRLMVTIAPVPGGQTARIDHLAQRTNQFNLTGARPPGVPAVVDPRSRQWGVEVTDRFGAYGLVGHLAARPSGDTLLVESFLLSSRALVRGVEHRMLSHLGRLARAEGLARVVLAYRHTVRNQPARDFLDTLPGVKISGADGSLWYEVDADAAASATYLPRPQLVAS